MTNKDKEQFLAEIKMIGRQKEYKELFGESINPINWVKKTDEILDTRKISYNYAFVKCCEKNGITNIDNIYNQLEKMWSDSKEELNIVEVLPLLVVGWLFALGKYQNHIRERWEAYINKTIDFAKTLDDSESVIDAV
jgi:hypothetical protein